MRLTLPLVLLACALAGCADSDGTTDDGKTDDTEVDDTTDTTDDTDVVDDTDATDDTDIDTTDDTDVVDDTDVDDTDVVTGPQDLWGLEGIWSGQMAGETWTNSQGGILGDFSRSESCPTGTATFVVDLSADPPVQLQSYSCPGVSIDGLGVTARFQLDADGEIIASPGQIFLDGTLTADAFSGSAAFGMNFDDIDPDGTMDFLGGFFPRTYVLVLGTPTSSYTIEASVQFYNVTRTGDLP